MLGGGTIWELPPDEGGGKGGSWEKEGKGGGFLKDAVGGRVVAVAEEGAAFGTIGGGGRVLAEVAGRKLVAGVPVGTAGSGRDFAAEEVGGVFGNSGGKTDGESTGVRALSCWFVFLPIPAGATGCSGSLTTIFGCLPPAVIVISRILPFALIALLTVLVAMAVSCFSDGLIALLSPVK